MTKKSENALYEKFSLSFFLLVFLSHFFIVCAFLPFSAIKLFLKEGSREKNVSKSWEQELFCAGMKDGDEKKTVTVVVEKKVAISRVVVEIMVLKLKTTLRGKYDKGCLERCYASLLVSFSLFFSFFCI